MRASPHGGSGFPRIGRPIDRAFVAAPGAGKAPPVVENGFDGVRIDGANGQIADHHARGVGHREVKQDAGSSGEEKAGMFGVVPLIAAPRVMASIGPAIAEIPGSYIPPIAPELISAIARLGAAVSSASPLQAAP